jgi:hypothetical protein
VKRILSASAALLAASILLFITLNLFDSREAELSALPSLPAASLGADNGFFLVWGFAEPPGSDLSGQAFRRQLLELFRDLPKNYFVRSRFGQWLASLNNSFRENWQGAGFYFPQQADADICSFLVSRRARITERRRRFAGLQQRYELVLRSSRLEDFTPPGFELPGRSAALTASAARLFAASRLLAALDGGWLAATEDLLQAADAGFRLVRSSRTLAANSLGKDMVELSLRALGALLSRPDCPPALAKLLLRRLPTRAADQFGTATVRAFTCLNFSTALARVKKDRIVDPFLLKDYFRRPAGFFALERFVAISGPRLFATFHALSAFFLKENETAAMARSFWESVGRLEETPPWQWGSLRTLTRLRATDATAGLFWWLRNPLGKMMMQSAVPYSFPIRQHYVYRSHSLKVRYDLTRLLVQARLAAGAQGGLSADSLRRLLAAAAERDPFSGGPYRFSRERGALYSVGSDGVDDQGREQPALWRDSDIAVPIQFVASDPNRKN